MNKMIKAHNGFNSNLYISHLLFVLVLISFFAFSSCDYINPEEKVPAYIDIQDIAVNEEFSQLSDAWVYVDNKLVGVYDLPAHFPVLAEGANTIKIRPGIKVNGISVTRGPYPFYKSWETDTTLVPAETLTLQPETKYAEGLDFQWVEKFESVAITMEPDDSTNVSFIKTDTVHDAPSEHVGVIEMQPDSIFTVQTIEQFFLPSDRDLYLELSYKADYYFELAWRVENLVDGRITENRIYQFNPTDEWQHTYIYLTDFTREFNTSQNKFRFMFGSKNNEDEPRYLYFDNIRLIHY